MLDKDELLHSVSEASLFIQLAGEQIRTDDPNAAHSLKKPSLASNKYKKYWI